MYALVSPLNDNIVIKTCFKNKIYNRKIELMFTVNQKIMTVGRTL